MSNRSVRRFWSRSATVSPDPLTDRALGAVAQPVGPGRLGASTSVVLAGVHQVHVGLSTGRNRVQTPTTTRRSIRLSRCPTIQDHSCQIHRRRFLPLRSSRCPTPITLTAFPL